MSFEISMITYYKTAQRKAIQIFKLLKRGKNPRFSHLFAHSLRGTILYFAIAFASIYFMFYLGQVVRKETSRRFHSIGLDKFVVLQRGETTRYVQKSWRPFDVSTVEYLKRDGNFIIDAAPELRLSFDIFCNGIQITTPVVGVFSGFQDVHGLDLKFGRFFVKLDSGQAFCVVGDRLYERLRRNSNDSLVGDRIVIGSQVYSVIGVLKQSEGFSGEYSISEALLVPYYSLAQYVANDRLSKITLRANPAQPISEVTGYLIRSLEQFLGDSSSFEVVNQKLFMQTISDRLRFMTIAFALFGVLGALLGSWHYLVNGFYWISQAMTKAGRSAYLMPLWLSLKVSFFVAIPGFLLGRAIITLFGYIYKWEIFTLPVGPVASFVIVFLIVYVLTSKQIQLNSRYTTPV